MTSTRWNDRAARSRALVWQTNAKAVQSTLAGIEAILAKANFNPNQPRLPRGRPDGGRWTRVGGPAHASPHRAGDEAAEALADGLGETGEVNRRLVRDTTGAEPWEVHLDKLRPDGSLAEQTVVNRDGSAIRSEFSPSAVTGWNERHTVIGADGAIATFQNLGLTQTILDGAGRVIQVATWTDRGPAVEILRPDLGFDRPTPGDGVLAGGLAITGLMLPLFAWFASTAAPGITPVLAFRAREFAKPAEVDAIEPVYVGRLDYEDAKRACPGIVDVQGWTNEAAKLAGDSGTYQSPAVYGTAVHTRLKKIVEALDDPDLAAERSYLKSKQEGYGAPGTVRIDVLDNRPGKAIRGTVCFYDIKTGSTQLGKARSTEIVREVLDTFPDTERFVVIEIRPST